MKIENGIPQIGQTQMNGLTGVDKTRAQKVKPTTGGEPVEKDQATLSGEALFLAKAMSELSGTTDDRQEKVESLRAQIMSGDYQISYEALARKLAGKLGLNKP